jgi:hypothetical protein
MKPSPFLEQAGEYPAQSGKPCRTFTRLWRADKPCQRQTSLAKANEIPLSKIRRIERSA